MTLAAVSSSASGPRPFLSSDRVRWADVDLVGIMRFSAFTRLVENAEQDLSRHVGLGYAEIMVNPEHWMPRRSLTIEYTAPARIDDELQLATYVSRIGESSLTLSVDVMTRDFRRLYAAATVVIVCVDAATFSKQPIPAAMRAALAPYTLSVDEARAWMRNNQASSNGAEV
ncbi:MAG: acyl-CoA thioesterase [Gemmatimonas sp.]